MGEGSLEYRSGWKYACHVVWEHRSTGNQEESRSRISNQSVNGCSPELLYNVNDLCHINKNQENKLPRHLYLQTSTGEADINTSSLGPFSLESSDKSIDEGTMSSENIVENEIDTSNPPMEPTLRPVNGDSNANSAQTPITVTDVVPMTQTSQDRERALGMLSQTEASKAASENPAIQPMAIGNQGTFYTQHGVLILDPSIQRGETIPTRSHGTPISSAC